MAKLRVNQSVTGAFMADVIQDSNEFFDE